MGVEVCPVHQAEFKNFHTSSIHVGAMSYDSQPRGLKRNHSDDEEEEEDSSAPVRKQMRFSQMRQEVLNITYDKLSRFKQSADCSLFQYVLLFNTMRNLEQEMWKEGARNGGTVGGPFLPTGSHQIPFDPGCLPPHDDPRTNINNCANRYPSANYSSSVSYAIDARTAAPTVINPAEAPNDIFVGGNSGVTYASEYERYLMDLDSPSSGRATPFPPRTDVESGALWNDDSDRLTSLNWSSVLKMVDGGNPSTVNSTYPETAVNSSPVNGYDALSSSSSSSSDCSVSDEVMPRSETSLHTLMPAAVSLPSCQNSTGVSSTSSSSSPNVSSASGSTSPISGSSPTSSEDEIFSDVDVALYDFDLVPLSPPNVRMAPVSAEELMWSLSNSEQPDNSDATCGGFYKKEEREHATSVHT